MEQRRIIVDPRTSVEVVLPTFATADQAIARSRRIDRGDMALLRMEPEYGCVIPLWDESGPVVGLVTDQLPNALGSDLERWQQHWESAYVFASGWRSDEDRANWAITGEEIFARLEQALWENYVIEP